MAAAGVANKAGGGKEFLKGFNFVIVGRYRFSIKHIKAVVLGYGANVSAEVSLKTTHLLVPSDPDDKLKELNNFKKAELHGTKLMTFAQLQKIFEDNNEVIPSEKDLGSNTSSIPHSMDSMMEDALMSQASRGPTEVIDLVENSLPVPEAPLLTDKLPFPGNGAPPKEKLKIEKMKKDKEDSSDSDALIVKQKKPPPSSTIDPFDDSNFHSIELIEIQSSPEDIEKVKEEERKRIKREKKEQRQREKDEKEEKGEERSSSVAEETPEQQKASKEKRKAEKAERKRLRAEKREKKRLKQLARQQEAEKINNEEVKSSPSRKRKLEETDENKSAPTSPIKKPRLENSNGVARPSSLNTSQSQILAIQSVNLEEDADVQAVVLVNEKASRTTHLARKNFRSQEFYFSGSSATLPSASWKAKVHSLDAKNPAAGDNMEGVVHL